MIYQISNNNPVPLTLCESDEHISIVQNIALILSVKRGTVPMYRSFGLPMEFIGKPLPVAETLAAQEIQTAISEFEPRATFKDVYLSATPDGKMDITVEVDI